MSISVRQVHSQKGAAERTRHCLSNFPTNAAWTHFPSRRRIHRIKTCFRVFFLLLRVRYLEVKSQYSLKWPAHWNQKRHPKDRHQVGMLPNGLSSPWIWNQKQKTRTKANYFFFQLENRLQSELMSLMMSAPPGISAFPKSDNLLSWTATMEGPSGTPYAGLTFKLTFDFPQNYPYSPPTVLFRTPVYHPNIDFSGRICLDILKDKWSAVYNVQTVLLSLQSLMGEPNK